MVGALVIFCYLGYYSDLTGVPIPDLPLKGPDLVFVTIPAAMANLPLPRLWIGFFFGALLLIGIDSQLGPVEAMVKLIHDLRPTFRGIFISEYNIRIFMCSANFLCGLFYATSRGFEFLQFVDGYCIFLPFLVIASVKLYLFGSLTSQISGLSAHG